MNKDIFTKEYMEKLKGVKLSGSSRARMEQNLIQYARFHTVRVAGDGRSIGRVHFGTRALTHLFNLQKKSMIAAFIALMLIVGGGTSYAAEGAVPGDFLYPVKIDVNENVQGALAVSDRSEAELQAKLAEERLKEAETLASRGKLTASVAADINARVKAHYENAEKHVEAEEARGDFDSSATVRASIEGSFRTHADVLSDLNTRIQGNDGEVLIGAVRGFATILVDAETKATATITTSADAHASVEAAVTHAQEIVTSAQNESAAHKDALSTTLAARVDADIEKAVAFQAKAKASLQANVLPEAYNAAQAAIRAASEARALLSGTQNLHGERSVKVDAGLLHTGNGKGASDMRSENESSTSDEVHAGDDSHTTGTGKVETGTHVETPVVNTTIKTETTGTGSLHI